jgi:MFS family permease
MALRSPVFWAIWLTGFLSFTGQVGFLFHEISIFTPRMGLVMAGYAVSVTVISAAIGRFVTGWAANHMPLGLLAGVMYLIQVTGFVVANAGDGVASSFIAAAIIGFVVGPLVMLPAMLTRAAFGADGFGKSFGVINIGMFAGMTIGPGLAGLVAAKAGYPTAIWMFAACLTAAAAVIILGFRPSQTSGAPE